MKDIEEQINTLIKLQSIDAQIYRLRKEKDSKPEVMAKLEQDYKEKLQALEASLGDLKSLQLQRKGKEVDLQSKEENVKKYQTQLHQIKTNKEYTALQTEIEGLKADNSLLEEEIIKFMEEIDKANEALSKKKEMLEAEERQIKEEEAKIKSQIEKLKGEIEILNKEREVLTPQLDPPILSKYERILCNKPGSAMVPVTNEACGGCRMKLPPQVINEIKMNRKIVSCEVCTRILYIAE